MAHIDYNVLIIEDQIDSINVFRKRFDNHLIYHPNAAYAVKYYFLWVQLEPREGKKWKIAKESVLSLIEYLKNIKFDLIFIDYSFVPPEMDEELTYKLSHHEIHKKEDLLGRYILDAGELFYDLYKADESVKQAFLRSNSKIIMYTYPADSLMHLLGDAKTRRNVLHRAIEKQIDILDTRQLLYGGDKNLERKHDRAMYPQLLVGYLNQLILIEMQKYILQLKSKKKSVILVHGIRTRADWYNDVRNVLVSDGFTVHFTNYDRFDLFRFLLPTNFFRNQVRNKIYRQIRAAIQDDQSGEYSIIAHSFGTYIVSHILQNEFDIKLKYVIFSGSVVRYDFPFEQFSDRFEGSILNEVATKDPWPAIAESMTTGYGSAGTFGFKRPRIVDRWHLGGHSHLINKENCRSYWLPFLNNGEIIETNISPKVPFWISALNTIRLKYWFIVLLFLLFYLRFGRNLFY